MKQQLDLLRHSLLGLTLVLVGASLSLSTAAVSAQSGTARPALTVSVTKPSLIALPSNIRANGNIAAWQDASVGAQVGGLRIAEVRVNVGDHVKKGQVLAVFAQDTVLADLAVQKAQESEAVAALADAEANASRARSLKTSGALSAQVAAVESGKCRLLQGALPTSAWCNGRGEGHVAGGVAVFPGQPQGTALTK
jgi:multidrug efflux pump subunit AcrA (membrane-fusion protein)